MSGRRRRKLLMVALAVLVIVGAQRLVMPRYRHYQINRALAGFEAHPSQETADRLSYFIRTQKASKDDGRRILTALLTPEIKTRSSYAAGGPAFISWRVPYRVDLGNMIVNPWPDLKAASATRVDKGHMPIAPAALVAADELQGNSLRMAGFPRHGRSAFLPFVAGAIDNAPHIAGLEHAPREPGEYRLVLLRRYEIKRRSLKLAWRRGKFPRNLMPRIAEAGWPSAYRRAIEMPVVLRIVAAGSEELVHVRSDGGIDEQMAAAFPAVPLRIEAQDKPGLGGGDPCAEVPFAELPENWSFCCALEDERGGIMNSDLRVTVDGRPSAVHYSMGRLRSGSSGRLRIAVLSERFRTYSWRGKLILKTALDQTYYDPDIKSAWDGTLEFPISFTAEH